MFFFKCKIILKSFKLDKNDKYYYENNYEREK